MTDRLRLIVRTPYEVVLDAQVLAARVPTETGQVGLRPREEPFVSVVEPGLCVVHTDQGIRFAATAGGLLDAHGDTTVLYTPFAVFGQRGDELLLALDRALTTPDGEIAARRRLGELEHRIVEELREHAQTSRTVGHHD